MCYLRKMKMRNVLNIVESVSINKLSSKVQRSTWTEYLFWILTVVGSYEFYKIIYSTKTNDRAVSFEKLLLSNGTRSYDNNIYTSASTHSAFVTVTEFAENYTSHRKVTMGLNISKHVIIVLQLITMIMSWFDANITKFWIISFCDTSHRPPRRG